MTKKERTLIKDATIVNERKQFKGSILIENGKIKTIYKGQYNEDTSNICIVDASNKICIPGVIDDQVHFREPGLTHKGDIFTESRAAVAGGVTSFMEMPNTNPQSVTQELLEEKFKLASGKSLANYSFYFGATNANLDELLLTNPESVCGIKIFMGSSTGNMQVDDLEVLSKIFSKSKMLIAVHCEDEETIQKNTIKYKKEFGEDLPIRYHCEIRNAAACYKSSSFAVNLAKKYNTRLHLLHISTAQELDLLDNNISLKEKKITGEVCVHHLWFDESDYSKYGTRIKWNPAIKSKEDREALLEGIKSNKLDVIATDHAPHLLSEKENTYFKAPSGGPLVQHSLVAMLELYHKGKIQLETIVEKMCHSPADLFGVKNRGFVREGYCADLVIIDLNDPWTVNKDNILYKCGWSPFEGTTFNSKVTHTYVNGFPVYENGNIDESQRGMRLLFSRL